MITSKQLKDIKETSLNQCVDVYLCCVADELGIIDFQEYLLNNLDDTMIQEEESIFDNPPRWKDGDLESRINWLDKHIKLLS